MNVYLMFLQAAAETKNKELRPWVPELIKHFWYCSRKADGSEGAMLVSFKYNCFIVTFQVFNKHPVDICVNDPRLPFVHFE